MDSLCAGYAGQVRHACEEEDEEFACGGGELVVQLRVGGLERVCGAQEGKGVLNGATERGGRFVERNDGADGWVGGGVVRV